MKPDDDEALMATMRAAASHILATFDRERIDPGVALGICGLVVSRLLEHAPHYRNEFIAALQAPDDVRRR